jgi:hypothetical protein
MILSSERKAAKTFKNTHIELGLIKTKTLSYLFLCIYFLVVLGFLLWASGLLGKSSTT